MLRLAVDVWEMCYCLKCNVTNVILELLCLKCNVQVAKFEMCQILKLLSLKYNVEVAMFEMQCKVTCLKCNVKVAKFEMQCLSCYLWNAM